MTPEEARAWGMAYRVVGDALRLRSGRGLSDDDIALGSREPAARLGEHLARAISAGALGSRDLALLSAALAAVDEDARGRLSDSEASAFREGYAADPSWAVMRPAEASDALGVSKQRVAQLCRDGSLDGFGGDGVYVTRASVEGRLASSPRAGRPPAAEGPRFQVISIIQRKTPPQNASQRS